MTRPMYGAEGKKERKCAMPKKSPKRHNEIQVSQTEPAVFGWTIDETDAQSPSTLASMSTYVESHCLMPDDYVFDGTPYAMMMVEHAAIIVERHQINDLDRLRAIVLLGHSPCRRAVSALEGFASRQHRLGQVAAAALTECIGLFLFPHPGTVPERFHSDDKGEQMVADAC